MADRSLEELDEKIETIKSKLSAQIQEIVDIITNDLPDCALKSIRKAFIEDVETAEAKSDEELLKFRERAAEFGRKLSEDIRASLLENMDDWWGKDISAENAGKTLDGNEAISRRLAVIGERISAFLDAEKLKSMEIVYKTPARFINGKYPPGMIEKYWASLSQLRSAEEERAELDLEARKARLAQRWDSV